MELHSEPPTYAYRWLKPIVMINDGVDPGMFQWIAFG